MRILCVMIIWVGIAFASKADAPYVIGVLYWSAVIPGQVAMRQGLEEEAAAINRQATNANERTLQLLVRVAGDGKKGIENQIAQMYELLEHKPNLLLVQPTDNAALAEPLQAANRLHIPVIAFDQYINGGQLTSYVTSDNYQAGYLDGEYAAATVPENRQLRVVLIEYPHVSSTVERVNGFLDALNDAKVNFRILKTYEAVEPVGGRIAGQALLKDFPRRGSVDLVFCVNDGGGLAVARELARAGRTEIFMATVDGDAEAIAIIRRHGMIRVDAAQFCRAIGQTAMRLAWQYLHGQHVSEQVLTPVFPLTAATVDIYQPRLEAMPEKYTKPWRCRAPLWQRNLKTVK